jgi:hypothetical protein
MDPNRQLDSISGRATETGISGTATETREEHGAKAKAQEGFGCCPRNSEADLCVALPPNPHGRRRRALPSGSDASLGHYPSDWYGRLAPCPGAD